jgi:membrane associated rhomboid family serine protease
VAVGRSPDEATLSRWTLSLLALGIPHQVVLADQEPDRVVLVRAVDGPRALQTLHEDDQEVRQRAEEDRRRRPPSPTPRSAILWAEAMAGGLTAMSYVAGSRAMQGPWMQRGRLDGADVFAGETHRLVTAVTLHADAAHLLGNVAFLLVVAPTVIRRVGAGVTALALLLTGAVGNVVTLGFHGPAFGNVGASGGIFGLCCVLGILASRTRSTRTGANRWVVGTGAALGLLSMLAFGENADVVAHLAGFAAGVPVGLWAPLREDPPQHPPGWWWAWQGLAWLGAGALVTWAWGEAWSTGL